MKRIKDIACISRPSANIRIKPAIMLLERYCFLKVISQILCKRRFRCKIEQNIFKAGAAQAAAALSTK